MISTERSSAETGSTAEAPRLNLRPEPSTSSPLDGGWWPRSTDAVAELPALIAALSGRWDRITHVLLNAYDWTPPHPRRLSAGGRSVRLGWYTSQPSGLITMTCDFNRGRIDLLVVPSSAGRSAASTAMAAAADPEGHQQAPALLAAIQAPS